MGKEYLTKERLEEFKKELEYLKNEKRNEVAQRLRQAKEYGDLSENSEYAEAREEQGNVEGRIFELEDLLKNAVTIEKTGTHAVVQVGSTVTIKKGAKTSIYTIVGMYEAKPEDGKISDDSPLGKAFMKHKEGDMVEVTTPVGAVKYEILKVE
ncbi:MAG: transcription elongation factor GreA [Candidatus Pacebacteria bacterium]|nr:transcription elongation factor GreA [Candidatus Paceibacterota bacterium]